jgi:hypothetical protein
MHAGIAGSLFLGSCVAMLWVCVGIIAKYESLVACMPPPT